MARLVSLAPSLSCNDIWHKILYINIQAIDNLLESKELHKWEFLLENYQSSIEDIQHIAEHWKARFEKEYKSEGISSSFLKSLPLNWYNTLKSTLYMMEEDLWLAGSVEGTLQLWDIFFEIDDIRNISYFKQLELKKLYYGNH